MLEALFWIVVGAFVGWNVERPAWSVTLQQKFMELFNRQ